MKVAFFQPYLANWRIDFLERFINESNYQVIVYDGGFSGKDDFKSVSNNNVPFKYKKLYSMSFKFNFSKQEYPVYFSPFLLLSLIKDKPNVVVTEGEINFLNNILIYIYCQLYKKKYVWWSLGKVRTRSKNVVNKVLDPVVDFLLFRSSCVMARNTFAQHYYVEHKGYNHEKVVVVPNSMDEDKAFREVDVNLLNDLLERKKGEVVLYVGALTAAKRPNDLLKAFNYLCKDPSISSKIELWFVGDGPEKESLKSQCATFELGDKVTFFGKIFKGVGSYFLASNIVVVPGLGGLVINHAMIFSKPVVSRLADGTELDLVIDGETGYLLDNYDNNELALAIKKALTGGRISEMSNKAGELVANVWNMKAMIAKVHDCINLCTRSM